MGPSWMLNGLQERPCDAEEVELTLGPKTDEDDLQRRVTLALADWRGI